MSSSDHCTADIPQGSDLTFSLEMVDDLNSQMKTDSGTLEVPEQFLHMPGGTLKTASWNLTLDNDGSKNYIIQSTYFQYMTNLSGIYYVPASDGDILFEVYCPKEMFHIAKNLFFCSARHPRVSNEKR